MPGPVAIDPEWKCGRVGKVRKKSKVFARSIYSEGGGQKSKIFCPIWHFDAAYAQKFEAGRFTLIVSNVGSHDDTSRMLS